MGVKKFGGVRRFAFNPQKNVEGGGPGRRDCGARIFISISRFSFCFHSNQYDGNRAQEEGIRGVLYTEFLSGHGTVATQKVSGRGALLAFQLQFEKIESCIRAAANEKAVAFALQFR